MRIQRLVALLMSVVVAALMLAWAVPWPAVAHAPFVGSSGQGDKPLENQGTLVENRAKLDAALLDRLAVSKEPEPFRVIVHMRDSADLHGYLPATSRLARRTGVVALLQKTAAASQANLVPQLKAMRQQGWIETYHPFWIFNGVAMAAWPRAIEEIARLPEVERITLDAAHRYFDPPPDSFNLEVAQASPSLAASSVSWGIERIGATFAWEALGIQGEGVTVAIMDSGVDWRHPDLAGNYRGNLGGGNVEHFGNWFHTVTPTATEPIDLLGHGTHVAGTAVGQNGIGVAPGARWIAVAITDQSGLIYDSSVHAGFEWLLAPEGDPSLAPDIVNNSWGGSPYATEFVDDVAALHAAGIIALFAAGNSGPEPMSINSPASYTGTIAVGASDDSDSLAWFSSRGPSPLTGELKPWLVAPGARILSALPDGKYGLNSGTSMATPHVAGAIALLLSVEPSLSIQSIMQLLADTAAPLSTVHPNDDSGWGRLNAYAVVSRLDNPGTLQGTVHEGGTPVASIVVTVTTPTGVQLPFHTDAHGMYKATLRPGLYTLVTSPFGYDLVSTSGLGVTAGQVTISDINLMREPYGTIRGVVRQAGTELPLRASIAVSGTPIVAASDGLGRYALELPADQYEISFSSLGYHLGRTSLAVAPGRETVSDVSLAPAPRVLLVDSGQWYYDSYADYYQEALFQAGYAHDRWPIRNPFEDVPSLEDLRPYDTVLWSAPLDSPGYLGANEVITDFLGTGGNLLISGQNVGALDGGDFFPQIWWYRDLEGEFTGKTGVTQTFTGATGAFFKGVSLALNGGSSAGNQLAVDVSHPAAHSLTRVAFTDEAGRPVGLIAGDCDPFRIAYLGYGLEGVSEAADRVSLLQRAFEYFQSPRLSSGVAWATDPVDDFALAGDQLVYTLTVRNLSETLTDTLTLDINGGIWPSSLLTRTLTLGPCQKGQSVLTIDVPADVPDDVVHQMELAARSANDIRNSARFQLRHKTPGKLLLVDDDRWYDQEATYEAALGGIGLEYDVWEIGWDENVRGSPPTEFLNAYDFVVWYTGYDWFAPVTRREKESLANFLAQGGRLFLTSQDFLYYHHDTPLARTYLGVIEYRESITPTAAYGADNPLLPESLAGPLPLTYGKYQNFSDGLVAAPGSQPFIWHDQGMAAGIATPGPQWRSIFWGIPFEMLPPSAQGDGMRAIMGWLSDLGESEFGVDRRSVAPGDTLVYTLTLQNLPYAPENHVWLTNSLPAELAIQPATISGGATFDDTSDTVTWNDVLGPGQSHVISYRATVVRGVKQGTLLENRATIVYERHGVQFGRVAESWVHAPDLSSSTLAAAVGGPGEWQTVTYTLLLRNDGLAPARPASVTMRLPDALFPLTETLRFSGGRGVLFEQRITWQGIIPPGKEVSVSVVMTRETSLFPLWLPATALIEDGVGRILLRDVQPYLRPYQRFFPIFFRDGMP